MKKTQYIKPFCEIVVAKHQELMIKASIGIGDGDWNEDEPIDSKGIDMDDDTGYPQYNPWTLWD